MEKALFLWHSTVLMIISKILAIVEMLPIGQLKMHSENFLENLIRFGN
tara:strand:+ start:53 stop:196 length:144 start_codon:yes stop_codon:yes gene_type:complete